MKFDIELYKEQHGDQLNVLVTSGGQIIPCTGNYWRDALQMIADRYDMPIDMVVYLCPYSNTVSASNWICSVAGVMFVQGSGYLCPYGLSEAQIAALQLLRDNDLYWGDIPYSECN